MPVSDSYKALCSDAYVNQKLALKLPLPLPALPPRSAASGWGNGGGGGGGSGDRQAVMDLFERIRRQFPAMDQFQRRKDELALETGAGASLHRWVAVRANTIRSGVVNPESLGGAYTLHRHVLDIAPFFLSVSPLDVEYLELLYGFDLLTARNHDQIVHEALIADTPLASVLDIPGATPIDFQPVFGFTLPIPSGTRSFSDRRPDTVDRARISKPGRFEAHIEIKTRTGSRVALSADQGADREGMLSGRISAEPISVYLWLRRYEPVGDARDLPIVLEELTRAGEELVETRIVPGFVAPLRRAILAAGE